MSIQQENFKKIADKIREKLNSTALIRPSTFAYAIEDVYKSGKNTRESEFWDEYQQNGERTNYKNAFYGSGWNDNTFKPKYDIVISGNADSHEYMFGNSGTINLEKILSDKNLKFDTSGITTFGPMFYFSGVTHLPEIDVRNVTKFSNTFLWSQIESIKKLILNPDGNQTFGNLFYTAQLKQIEFEGTINTDIDLYSCSKLNKDSIYSLFSVLSDSITSKKTCTLSKKSVNAAFQGYGYEIDENSNIIKTSEIVSGSNSYEWFMFTTNFSNTHSYWSIFLA